MVSMREFIRLHEAVKRERGELYIYFAGCRYGIKVARLITAFERSTGDKVEWPRAFGTKRPTDVINTMKIESIVYRVGDREETFTSLRDLMKRLL